MNESIIITKKQRFVITCFALMFMIAAFLYMGVSDLARGIAAKNANVIDYNEMTQSEMKKYSYISGNIEYVHSYIGEGRTQQSLTYGLKNRSPYYSNYFLVECPYSPDNTMMLLHVSTHSNLSDRINTILDEINSGNISVDDYSLPFTGYLVKSNRNAVSCAYDVLRESGLENVTVAPYMINCEYQEGFANAWVTSGICYIIFAVMLILAILLYLRKNYLTSYVLTYNNPNSSLGVTEKPRMEDYFGEIYHSNTGKSNDNNT